MYLIIIFNFNVSIIKKRFENYKKRFENLKILIL